MCACTLHNGEHVIHNRVIDPNLLYLFLKFRQLFRTEYARSVFAMQCIRLANDFAGAFGVRIADAQAHQKTVQLRFGQGVSALMTGGVLRGDHHERFREGQTSSLYGNLLFVHGFEQGRLRLGRGAVDFVGEQKVGEDGAGLVLEFGGAGVINGDTEDVRREQVAGELKAVEGATGGAGEGLRESGFSHARHVFEQQVPTREKADQSHAHGFRLAAKAECDGGFQLPESGRGNTRGQHWQRVPHQVSEYTAPTPLMQRCDNPGEEIVFIQGSGTGRLRAGTPHCDHYMLARIDIQCLTEDARGAERSLMYGRG